MKNKIIASLLSLSILFPVLASAASVTIESIPTVCSSAVFRGTASYTNPDTLTVKLNGSTLYTSTSGDSTWQTAYTGTFTATNTLTVEVSSSTAGVIASASASFSASCGSTNPWTVLQPWGLTGADTPLVNAGTTVKDKYGFIGICPEWAGKTGCFDVTGTSWYLDDIVKYLLNR